MYKFYRIVIVVVLYGKKLHKLTFTSLLTCSYNIFIIIRKYFLRTSCALSEIFVAQVDDFCNSVFSFENNHFLLEK